jgi:hypothetical protein
VVGVRKRLAQDANERDRHATPGYENLAVPSGAIVPVGEERTVLVQTGTTDTGQIKLQHRRVVLGEAEGDLVAVRRGLTKDDRIVVSGAVSFSQ